MAEKRMGDMIKFMHCADLHLDSPFKGLARLPEGLFKRLFESTFLSFERLVRIAVSEQVDFVIIAGDLYDSGQRSLKAQSFLKHCFEKLQTHNIDVFIIHGNHDPLDGQWVKLDWPENVHFFDGHDIQSVYYEKEGERVACIHGFSYETAAVTDDRTTLFPEKKDGLYHIGVLHGQADGYSGHSPYAPFLVSELLKKGYDYWALGHIHKRMDLHDEPPIRYSGNIQGRHAGETGQKGGYVVKLNAGHQESHFFATSDIEWHEALITLDNLDSMQDLLTTCKKVKEEFRTSGKGVLLRIKLSGRTALYQNLLDGSFLEDLLEILSEDDALSSFVHVVSIKNEARAALAEEIQLKQSGFFKEVIDCIQDELQIEEALSELTAHRLARRYASFTAEDWADIKQQAEELLLSELHKG
jgi:DNA repair protein SbcD/Mre11